MRKLSQTGKDCIHTGGEPSFQMVQTVARGQEL